MKTILTGILLTVFPPKKKERLTAEDMRYLTRFYAFNGKVSLKMQYEIARIRKTYDSLSSVEKAELNKKSLIGSG